MKTSSLTPSRHLFVCVNARPPGDPLGSGCSGAGESVYSALKAKVSAAGLVTRVWVTRTHCLGLCPPTGATVASHPGGDIFTEVDATNVPEIWHTVRRTEGLPP